MPNLERTKSYFTGSSGSMALNAAVISMAVAASACFRRVSPSLEQIRIIWTSTGITSLDGGTSSQPPGSTRSRRAIHRRKRFSRLHALPRSGRGRRVEGRPPPDRASSSTKCESAGWVVSCSGRNPATKHLPSEPYLSTIRLMPLNNVANSSRVVKRY